MNKLSLLKKGLPYFLVIIAGACTPFAFSPIHFYLFALLTPAILFKVWQKSLPKEAFIQGLLFGISFFSIGVSWVFISIHEFGNTSIFIASLLTFFFILVLAFFIGLQGYLYRRYFSQTSEISSIMTFSALWVIMEWVRSGIFSGFPWLILGYSQIHSALSGYIPILGEYGVSFLLTLSSGLLILFFSNKKRFLIASIFFMIWLSGFALSKIEWTKPKNLKWYKVALLQGDIPQELKWNPDYLNNTLKTYLELTRQHLTTDIIIWPESAIPTAYQYVNDFLIALNEEAKANNIALIVGIPSIANQKTNFEDHYYNGLFTFGKGSGSYFKRHLVPFGEYLPLKKLLHGLIAFFDIPMSDFIPGKMAQEKLKLKDLSAASFICYEIAYPEIVRYQIDTADLLITISNDSWFGNSLAPWQHLEIGQFRALQTGRYMLFASNSGVTAIINPKGIITKIIPQFKTAVLTGEIQAMVGITPWMKIGSLPIIFLLFLNLLFIKLKNKR
ncbi:MAG: Apolipoprotein N-acyltransferase [Legionellaceae bacterium]